MRRISWTAGWSASPAPGLPAVPPLPGVTTALRLGACTAAFLVALSPLLPSPLSAQEGRRDGSLGAAAIGGVVGGTVGFFTGAMVGASADCSELCLEIVVGALIGETVGLALGAHVLNDARGSLAADLGVSAGIMAVGAGLATLDSGDELLFAAMIGQIIAVSITEVRTSPWIEPTAGMRRSPEGIALEIGFSVR